MTLKKFLFVIFSLIASIGGLIILYTVVSLYFCTGIGGCEAMNYYHYYIAIGIVVLFIAFVGLHNIPVDPEED